MSYRVRLILTTIGIAILGFALLALAYTFWPLAGLSEQFPLAPTLFSPP